MKYLFFIIWLFCSTTFGAVNAGTVWEWRSTATGSMVNGCGYDSTVASAGTDYSQQDSAQFAFSDLATTNGTTNPCVVTSASHNFVSTDNGDIIHIASGGTFTAGWYEIKSTSGNAATLDRACASGASTSAGVWKEGGSCNTGSATLDSSFFAALAAGNTVWIKNGTYSAGSAISAGTAGGSQQPILIRGYNSSRGDNPTDSTRPTISMGAANFALAADVDTYNIIVTGSGANGYQVGAGGKVFYSKFINTSTTAARSAIQALGGNNFLFGVEGISYRGPAFTTITTGIIEHSYFHDSDIGIQLNGTTNGFSVIDTISADNVTDAVKVGGSQTAFLHLDGLTLYGSENKQGTGLGIVTGVTNIRFSNSILYGFATGASHADSQTVSFDDYNDYNNNTTDTSNWTKGANDVTTAPVFLNVLQLTGTGATSSSSTLTDSGASFNGKINDNIDFLTITSGTGVTAGKYLITGHTNTTLTTDLSLGSGSSIAYQVTYAHNFQIGNNLRNKGFAGSFPAALTTGYKSIGAVQQMPGYPRGKVVNK